MDAIFEATKTKCVMFQEEIRKWHPETAHYAACASPNLQAIAIRLQYENRHHYQEAWMRLARLIGVE